MDQESTAFWRNLETITRTAISDQGIAALRVPGLTILAHPDLRRIGERAVLTALASGQEVALSRLDPLFAAPGDAHRRPLADPHLSRRPFLLARTPEGTLRLSRNGAKTQIAADTVAIGDQRDLAVDELERGVVLQVAKRITLLLHMLDPVPPEDLPSFDLVGESAAMVAVRQQISRVADLEVPALLRGETGTGKELVANAIHRASRRRAKPFVAVNMGAIPPTLAAAELFGAAKGAFTGADRKRTGYFTRARGGTLFLDEIGEMPPEVQVLLLRTLETGEIQPVGSETSEAVDIRILAATDAQLESEIDAGRFRAPLLHRLSGYEIRLPPLRERRDDLGRLLLHFLQDELRTLGESWRLEPAGGASRPWLPASVVERLAVYAWPGNVRQLRNVARHLVIDHRGAPQLSVTPQIQALLEDPAASGAVRVAAESTDSQANDLAEASGRSVLRTLLLTDLVDSTRVVERLGDQRAVRVLSMHDREARRLLTEYDGHEIDKSDGFLFLFERPADAVGYALEYHENLTAMSEDLGVELAARAGVHLGEVFVRKNSSSEVARGAKAIEVEGIAKPMAARLMTLAGGGQTLLTRTVYDLARQVAQGDHPLAAPIVRWMSHGRYRVKGVQEPIEVMEVGVEGAAPLSAPADTLKARQVAASADAPDTENDPATRAGEATGEGLSSEREPVETAEVKSGSRASYRSPNAVEEEELLLALRAHQFRLQPTAAALGISRTSLYSLIDKSQRIRKARDLTREEIERSRSAMNGDLDAMAEELEVSRKGLSRRMTQLGVS
ncbi:MAG: sigma 54-interacting transcriptional regulator [Acidobacteriota bacterium]